LRGVGEEHQAQAAQQRVEAGLGERQGSAVRNQQREVRPRPEALARLGDHRGRDVGGRDVPGRGDRGEGGLGGEAGAGGDVEDALAGGEACGADQDRDEVRRHPSHQRIIASGRLVAVAQFGHWDPPPSSATPPVNGARWRT
jgi:hypothetical protein